MNWTARNRSGDPSPLAWAALLALGVAAGADACGGDRAEAAGGVAEDAPSPVQLATVEFDVEGMTCGGCALATEVALKKLDGVAGADARYDERTGEGRCTVEYDPARIGTDRMMAAIRDLGYEPTLLETKGDE